MKAKREMWYKFRPILQASRATARGPWHAVGWGKSRHSRRERLDPGLSYRAVCGATVRYPLLPSGILAGDFTDSLKPGCARCLAACRRMAEAERGRLADFGTPEQLEGSLMKKGA